MIEPIETRTLKAHIFEYGYLPELIRQVALFIEEEGCPSCYEEILFVPCFDENDDIDHWKAWLEFGVREESWKPLA
jgi:hypothetical protein